MSKISDAGFAVAYGVAGTPWDEPPTFGPVHPLQMLPIPIPFFPAPQGWPLVLSAPPPTATSDIDEEITHWKAERAKCDAAIEALERLKAKVTP